MKFQPKTNNTGIFIAACVLLVGLLYVLSKNKNRSMMSELESPEMGASSPEASSSEASYASANGIQTTTPNNLPQAPPMLEPSSMLPHDTNSQWASLSPAGNGSLEGVSLLQAGAHIGMNTQGSSLRNANLQLRSEPIIEIKNVGPWMNSTMEADKYRKSLEIGGTV